MFLTSWVSVLYSLLDSKLSDSLYKTNPHIDDAPAIDEKIAKITMQGVGIFRGNQKRLKEKYGFYSCFVQLSAIAHQPT